MGSIKQGSHFIVQIRKDGKAISADGQEFDIDESELQKLNKQLVSDSDSIKNRQIISTITEKKKTKEVILLTDAYRPGLTFHATMLPNGKVCIPIFNR